MQGVKSEYMIQLEFQNALRQANELEQIAGNLAMVAYNEFLPCLKGISVSWKGENAKEFYRKGDEVKENIMDSSRDLMKTAKTIRQIAQTIYEAEKRNREIAQNRDY